MSPILHLLRATTVAAKSYEDYVDTRMGTNSDGDFSRGNTLPLTMWPWGFNSFSMYNQSESSGNWGAWFFKAEQRYVNGIKLTHCPSPWIGDWAQWAFSWIYQQWQGQNDVYIERNSRFKPSETYLETGIYSDTEPSKVMVTASEHGGILRFEYTPTHENNKIKKRTFKIWYPGVGMEEEYRQKYSHSLNVDSSGKVTMQSPNTDDPLPSESCKYTEVGNDRKTFTVTCVNRNSNGSAILTNPLVMYLYGILTSDQPADTSADEWRPDGVETRLLTSPEYSNGVGNYSITGSAMDFPLSTTFTEFRMATSLISAQQAMDNFTSEIGNKPYSQVKAELEQKWDEVLSAVTIEKDSAPDDELRTFYSSLYRAALFPRDISEVKDGKRVHWSPVAACRHDKGVINTDVTRCTDVTSADPVVYDGPFSTDSGFWDAYHTIYGLQALLWPERYMETIEGYINHFRENRWIAQWASPGYKASMTGTMSDNILADALVKGLVKESSVDDAWEAMLTNLHDPKIKADGYPSPNGSRADKYGRLCLAEYAKLNFVPADKCNESVSRSTNYWSSDSAIVTAGVAIKKITVGDDLYKKLTKRLSDGPDALFDNSTEFMRPKNTDGGRPDTFDPYGWGGYYTEASAWQYRFALRHDIHKLQFLYGEDQLCQTMDSIHTAPPLANMVGYGNAIHEASEFINTTWGQYMHNNQPGHPHLWLQLQVAKQSKDTTCLESAIHYLRRVVKESYTPEAYPGDEDNGEMSAWYVLTSLGLYDLSPGKGLYSLGAPNWKKASIKARYPTKRFPTDSSQFKERTWEIHSSCETCTRVDYSAISNLNDYGQLPYSSISGVDDASVGDVTVEQQVLKFKYFDSDTTKTPPTINPTTEPPITTKAADSDLEKQIQQTRSYALGAMILSLLILIASSIIIMCIMRKAKYFKNGKQNRPAPIPQPQAQYKPENDAIKTDFNKNEAVRTRRVRKTTQPRVTARQEEKPRTASLSSSSSTREHDGVEPQNNNSAHDRNAPTQNESTGRRSSDIDVLEKEHL